MLISMYIAVLMSTFNGAQYLKAQIDSILNQNLPDSCDLILYIRDDGSDDHTRDILEDYADHCNNIVYVNPTRTQNLGVRDSFLTLLHTAYNSDIEFDYFAFADQDDFWLENKIAAAINKLKFNRNKNGALYYSNKYITDENLKIQKKEEIVFYNDFLEVMWSSLAFGCTMVFDKKLAGQAVAHDPEIIEYHDSWVYRIAKCIGANIVFDDSSYILYRQHSNNEVGKNGCKTHNGIAYMVKHFFLNIIKPREQRHQKELREINAYYSEFLNPDVRPYMDAILHYTSDIKKKYFLLRAPEMKKRPFLTRMVWVYKLLLNIM